MGAGKTLTKLVAIGAAIGGAIFFWRKTHAPGEDTTPAPAFPPPADRHDDAG